MPTRAAHEDLPARLPSRGLDRYLRFARRVLGWAQLDVFVVERDDPHERSKPNRERRRIVVGRIVELVRRIELVFVVGLIELLQRLLEAGRRDGRLVSDRERLRLLVLRLHGRERQDHARELAQL